MTDLTQLIDKELKGIEGYGDYSDAYLQLDGALRALKVCIEALAWYAEWDWSDKYVQPVPKASIKALDEVRKIVGGE